MSNLLMTEASPRDVFKVQTTENGKKNHKSKATLTKKEVFSAGTANIPPPIPSLDAADDTVMSTDLENPTARHYNKNDEDADEETLFSQSFLSLRQRRAAATPTTTTNTNATTKDDTITCPICLEDYDDDDIEIGTSTQRLQLETCGHSFCRDCLRQHCQYAIAIQKVPIVCPRSTCESSGSLTPEIIRTVLLLPDQTKDATTTTTTKKEKDTTTVVQQQDWDKYQKLNRLLQNPNLRECPGCEMLISIENVVATNDVQCPLCQHRFCLIHGNAHRDVGCSAYQLTPEARQWAETEAALDRYTKPCSHCGCRIQKSHGCDHVVCGHCHADMCWKCGTHMYLTGTMVRRCRGCKRDYRDHRYDRVYRIRLCICLPLLFPMIALYVALATVTAIVTGCFGGCFRCGRCFDSKNQSKNTTTTTTDNKKKGSSSSTAKEQQRKGTARHGICASAIVIFLPFIVLLEDFGIHMQILDELFPEPDNEMPFLPVVAAVDADATMISAMDEETV